MNLVDSHCHIDLPEFDHDRERVLANCHDLGIGHLIVPAITAEGWPRLKSVCAAHPGLHPAYGLHPMFMDSHRPGHISLLGQWIEREKPVAIGECGLDFYIENPDRRAQLDLFEQHLALARSSGLPVIVHARKSVEEVINSLRHFPGVTGVLHSYSGSLQQAERLLELGFLLGFGGPVTYGRAKRLHELVRSLPAEGLLLETDAPDQPGETHRGGRNSPEYLVEILDAISRLRDMAPERLAEITTENARRLFGPKVNSGS